MNVFGDQFSQLAKKSVSHVNSGMNVMEKGMQQVKNLGGMDDSNKNKGGA